MTMRNGRCCPAADTQEPNINCAGVGSALCWWMLGVWAPASSQENADDIGVILAHNRLRHCPVVNEFRASQQSDVAAVGRCEALSSLMTGNVEDDEREWHQYHQCSPEMKPEPLLQASISIRHFQHQHNWCWVPGCQPLDSTVHSSSSSSSQRHRCSDIVDVECKYLCSTKTT